MKDLITGSVIWILKYVAAIVFVVLLMIILSNIGLPVPNPLESGEITVENSTGPEYVDDIYTQESRGYPIQLVIGLSSIEEEGANRAVIESIKMTNSEGERIIYEEPGYVSDTEVSDDLIQEDESETTWSPSNPYKITVEGRKGTQIMRVNIPLEAK